MTWEIADRHVLVTGATSGIGLATATELARRGARVTITARDTTKGDRAAADIAAATGVDVAVRLLDLSSLDSVREFAAEVCNEETRLDVLINNAGAIAGSRRLTPDGFEWTFGVNHLGPFLVTNLLADLLTSSSPARVINVSSEAHRSAKRGLDFDDLDMSNGYSSSKAYAASKLANILFTVELDRRWNDRGIVAKALHPGVVATSFGKGPEGSRWMGFLMTALSPVLRKPDRGAATTVMLATANDDSIGRSLYWSDEQPKQPSPAAEDPNVAMRLWTESERLVGLPPT